MKTILIYRQNSDAGNGKFIHSRVNGQMVFQRTYMNAGALCTWWAQAGTVYVESDKNKYHEDESAGIYDVLENRQATMPEKTIIDLMKMSGQVNGYYDKTGNEYTRDIVAKSMDGGDDAKGYDARHYNGEKAVVVTRGVMKAMIAKNNVKDYSNGATNWQGKDLGISTRDAYKKYYDKDGITFKNTNHNLWGLKDNPKTFNYEFKTGKGKIYLRTSATNKWITTGTGGNTTFFKRTEESLKAENAGNTPKPGKNTW